MNANVLLSIGCMSGALAVGFGAFAAHGLAHLVTPAMLSVFKTGVQYQFYHTFALLFCGGFVSLPAGSIAKKYCYRAAICFIIGILCFSGSLYLLVLTGIKWWGPVTPIGGLFFIAGWLLMFVAAIKFEKVTE